MRWTLLISSALALALLGLIYLTLCVSRFHFLRRFGRGTRFLLALATTAAAAALLVVGMSLINAVVVLLHLALFFLIFGLLVRLAERLRGKAYRLNWQGILAIAVCTVYLAAGYLLCHAVRQTDYRLESGKKLGTLRVALITDSHLGTTLDAEDFAGQLARIEAQEPDLLVIVGDFVDDSTPRDVLLGACEALGETDFPYGVWFAYGNHDRGYGVGRDFSADDLEAALRENGVRVLKDETALIDGRFYLAGRLDASFPSRKTADELLAGLDTDKYIILLDHQPGDYENEANTAADLVLSGHTHGGQMIPVTYVGEWIGVNDRTYGHETRRGTDFIVSSGISSWELQFKTGTRSEYVIITIEGR